MNHSHSSNKIIILLGDSKVGKTTLITKLTKNRVDHEYKETFGCDFTNYEISSDNQKINLSIWDSYGKEDVLKILPSKLYKIAKAFIIVVSYSDRASLINVGKWNSHIRNFITDDSNIPIIVMINKADIQNKEFTREEAFVYIKNYEIPYIYESSIYGNVKIVINSISDLLNGRSYSFRKSSVLSNTHRLSLLNMSNSLTTNANTLKINNKHECYSSPFDDKDEEKEKTIEKEREVNGSVVIRSRKITEVSRKEKNHCCF